MSVDKLTYISNLKSDGTSSLELLDVKMNSSETHQQSLRPFNVRKINLVDEDENPFDSR